MVNLKIGYHIVFYEVDKIEGNFGYINNGIWYEVVDVKGTGFYIKDDEDHYFYVDEDEFKYIEQVNMKGSVRNGKQQIRTF